MVGYGKSATEHNSVNVRKHLGMVKTGRFIGVKWKNRFGQVADHSLILEMFGCHKCSWVETRMCPHFEDVTRFKPHAQRICSQRALWVKELYALAGNKTKSMQVDHIVKLQFLSDDMLAEYLKTGKLPDRFHHISKNLIAALDKLRKQDEGIKYAGDESEADKFRLVIEAKYKEMKDVPAKIEEVGKDVKGVIDGSECDKRGAEETGEGKV